jgi:hypothetical protein
MGGGLMQLVAYGAQDVYLTGNPQITFFKVVYRRHTNFSIESILQVWEGGMAGHPTSNTATIRRNGDLVYRMWLEVIGSDNCVLASTTNQNPGTSWIKHVELEIGGQRIDKHSGDWLKTYYSLTQPNPTGGSLCMENSGYQNTGTLFQFTSGSAGFNTQTDNTWLKNNRFHVPLQFFFCRNPGLALPLIALQYHEVKVHVENTFKELFQTDSAGSSEYKLWVDYVFLDTDERRRFSQLSHEYLIEQVQEQIVTDLDSGSELSFNHPVKELVWISRDSQNNNSKRLVGEFQLKFNGKERFAPRDTSYFTRVQILDHHTGCGGVKADNATKSNFDDSIAVYSFALKPEDHQPSGSCNFSRLDHVELTCHPTKQPTYIQTELAITEDPVGTKQAKVFAVNYNVLRIMSGMGGLAYAN